MRACMAVRLVLRILKRHCLIRVALSLSGGAVLMMVTRMTRGVNCGSGKNQFTISLNRRTMSPLLLPSKLVTCCDSMNQERMSVPFTRCRYRDVSLAAPTNPRCPQAKDTRLTPCNRAHPTRWITPVTHSRFKVRRRTATPMNAVVDTTTETPQLTLALLFLLLPRPRT